VSGINLSEEPRTVRRKSEGQSKNKKRYRVPKILEKRFPSYQSGGISGILRMTLSIHKKREKKKPR